MCQTFVLNRKYIYPLSSMVDKIIMPIYLSILMLLTKVTHQNVISTVQGRIRGVVHDGYVSYLGVPYATEVEKGRFKKAGIAPFWLGIRDSHEAKCSPVADVQECLRLDIHVPSKSGHWPVLAWVAGGGAHYNARQMVLKDIVMVMVHHRIGPSGFMCLKEEQIPGNAAVKDVVLALRWVRDNIVAFHGNPSRVVLAGQSLGAAIVEAIALSTMGNGLYHGVILQSGSVLSPWAFNYDAKERAIKLFGMFFDTDNMTNFFLSTELQELAAKSIKLNVPYFPLGLCIEAVSKHEETLLTEAPYAILLSRNFARVPMIIGCNTNEAYVFSSMLVDAKVPKSMSVDISFLLPEELKFLNDREMKQASRQVKDMYFSNMSISSLLAYHRDAYFVNHIHRSARLHATAHSVYYYQFSHSGNVGVQEEPSVEKTGAAHSDELAYLFSDRNLDGNDVIVQNNLLKLWTNFVKYLNPTYKDPTRWDTLDPDHPRVLDISFELKMMDYPYSKTASMWDDMYDKYYYSRHRG